MPPPHIFTDTSHTWPDHAPACRLDKALRELYPAASWGEVRRLVTSGKVSVDGSVIVAPEHRLEPGAALAIRMNARRPTAATELARERIVFSDAHVVVVSKPAGISTVPYEERERGSLDQLVRATLRRRGDPRAGAALGVVQRLDKQTSGLLVFAKTLSAKRHLQQQFRAHSVYRRYLALVHGDVDSQTVSSRLVTDRGDGLRGSTDNPQLGRPATTHVKRVEPLLRATLIECRLETGRTHQIRIHLSELGNPLLGETVYVRNYDEPLITAQRLMLHAAELGFVHPATQRELRFREDMPRDMAALLNDLRRTRSG